MGSGRSCQGGPPGFFLEQLGVGADSGREVGLGFGIEKGGRDISLRQDLFEEPMG